MNRLRSIGIWSYILYRVHEKPDKGQVRFSLCLRILGYRLRSKLDDVHPHTCKSVEAF